MIHTADQLTVVARRARRWRDRLRLAPVLTLSAGERAELSHILDELQHCAVHGTTEHPRRHP